MDESGAAGGLGEQALSASVLVLNRHYAAVRIVPARRAFVLLYRGRAEAIDQEEGQYVSLDFDGWLRFTDRQLAGPPDHQLFVRTPRRSILVPRVIRLVRYEKVPRNDVKYNRRNVLVRDDHHCQYCGRRFPVSRLSIDHVVPKSRGGGSTWTNVVTACNDCNTRKGGRLPQEASMRLIREPRAPRRNPFVDHQLDSGRYRIWRDFLRDGERALDA
ncbi:MAG: HNH endonuclease [Planctomycetes bacterium]|nr:HNH endonuclease [Planctomycetota bacterium]